MRRDSTYNQNIKYFIFFLLATIYLSLSSIYQLFSPLLGVVIYYLLGDVKENKNIYPNILFYIYLVFIDASKGQFLFSSLILFFIIYNFLLEDIKKIFRCKKCIIFGFIVVSYFGYYAINLFFASLFNQDAVVLSSYIYFYILFDFILVVLFL